MLHLLLVLSFASGMCGIAYEILYARLLTTYLGDMFFVSAAILATFLLGIAVGSLLARRFVHWLWTVELLIGLYAAALATIFSVFGQEALRSLYPQTAGKPALVIVAVSAFLILPATLVGCSVPLFAAYCRGHSGSRSAGAWFEKVYGFYNLGATFCVLLIEFLLLRRLGIRNTLFAIAGVNFASAAALFRVPPPHAQPETEPFELTAVRRPALALFVASVLSGVFQMVFLKFVEVFFGPYHENFALSVALALLGISVGTWATERRRWPFQRVLLWGAALLATGFLLLYPIARLWGYVNAFFTDLGLPTTVGKAFCLLLMGIVPFSVFGSTVPALIREHQGHRRAVGYFLFVSSLGNCVGYLAAVFWVYQSFSYRSIVLLLAGLLLGSGVVAGPLRKVVRLPWAVATTAAAMLGLVMFWPEWIFSLEYQSFVSPAALEKTAAGFAGTEVLRRYDSHISVVTSKSGAESLNINGHRSLMSYRGQTIPTEIVYGLVPANFAPRRGHALVLGVGTGMSAGTAALLYQHVTTVEINPAMLEMLPRWREHNFDLHLRKNVTLVLDDGLSLLARKGERYDAIMNTVTGPLYFSSSKLYTKDFFDLVKARLAPDGVYTMWFDAHATDEGARIIFTTLAHSFADCVFVFLRTGYSQVICSQQPIQARTIPEDQWPEPIRAKLAERGLTPVSALVDALALPAHHLFDTAWNAPVNTFDLPALEYTMASSSLRLENETFQSYAMLRVDFRKSAFRSQPLNDAELAVRCARLRILGGAALPECLSALGVRDAGLAPYEYVRTVLDFLRGGISLERETLIGRLMALGHTDEALAELKDLVAVGGETARTRLAAIRGQLRNAETVSDAALSDLIQMDPLLADSRRAVIATLLRREQWDLALRHSEILKRMRDLNERDAIVAAQLQEFTATGAP
jgi:predicted membrane-bound spermidine synthase